MQLPRLLRGTTLGAARLTAPRDCDIRWSHEQRKRHLPPILNHAHFPILPRFPSKNPPSMILAGAHEVLPVPWQSARGCRLLLLETLVETRMSLSTCCRRVDNRVRLGQAKALANADRAVSWEVSRTYGFTPGIDASGMR